MIFNSDLNKQAQEFTFSSEDKKKHSSIACFQQ